MERATLSESCCLLKTIKRRWAPSFFWLTCVIIRFEAMLRPNTGLTLLGDLAVFTRSAITPPKVNRFGWNLKHSEYVVGGWPRQILGAIRAVATVWEAGEIFCPLNNARFHRSPVGQISWNLNTTTSIGVAMKSFGTEFWKYYRKESFFQKCKHFLQNFYVLRFQAATTP